MADKDAGYSGFIARFVGSAEAVLYLIVALFLVLMAVAAFFIVARDLSSLIFEGLAIDAIYTALNDLLIVLIIAELLQIIVVFIQKRQLDLRLILAAGLTAMIRRVLIFGVENIPWEEMAVTAVLIAIIAAAIYVIGREKIEFSK
ncbi:MAG: Phosphate-starvation-inducible E [Methanocella sp. PtaU1.Bin125]|nr:MAG: Phosphate-starvation-inducible E [Methanocella sp. PtaU1.Bin125]